MQANPPINRSNTNQFYLEPRRSLRFLLLVFLACFSMSLITSAQDSKIQVTFKNDSKKDVWVLVQYLSHTYNTNYGTPSESDWIINGWYRINKGQSAYLFDTKNRKYYFYATTSTDFFGNFREWKGSFYAYFQGKEYGFREIEIADSEITYTDEGPLKYTLRLTK